MTWTCGQWTCHRCHHASHLTPLRSAWYSTPCGCQLITQITHWLSLSDVQWHVHCCSLPTADLVGPCDSMRGIDLWYRYYLISRLQQTNMDLDCFFNIIKSKYFPVSTFFINISCLYENIVLVSRICLYDI